MLLTEAYREFVLEIVLILDKLPECIFENFEIASV